MSKEYDAMRDEPAGNEHISDKAAGAAAGADTAGAGATQTADDGYAPARLFAPWPPRWRLGNYMYLALAVLATMLSIFAVIKSWQTSNQVDALTASMTYEAVQETDWTPTGDYKVSGGHVIGQVTFGDRCKLWVGAPKDHPQRVTLFIPVETWRWGPWHGTRQHKFALADTKEADLLNVRMDFKLGDCRRVP